MFGLSGSKSKSSSTGSSSSFSFGSSDSQQGSFSSSVSGGRSVAGSTDAARSNQSIAFEDVFARLFGNAEQTAANLDPSALVTASNQLFSGGTDFLSRIGGDAGTDYLNERLNGDSGLLDSQLGLLQADVGRLFSEELLPAITGEAVAGGALGGGRQGVAQGQAAQAASEAFQKGAVELRSKDQAQRDAIAQGVADRSIQGAQVGLAGLPGLMQLAQSGFGAELAPMQLLSAILGGRDVLTQSESTGQSFSNAEDFARSLAESFGWSTSRDMSASESKTQSSGSSKSFGIGW